MPMILAAPVDADAAYVEAPSDDRHADCGVQSYRRHRRSPAASGVLDDGEWHPILPPPRQRPHRSPLDHLLHCCCTQLVAHLMGCAWYFMAADAGLGSGTWADEWNMEDRTRGSRYIISVYWAFVTVRRCFVPAVFVSLPPMCVLGRVPVWMAR